MNKLNFCRCIVVLLCQGWLFIVAASDGDDDDRLRGGGSSRSAESIRQAPFCVDDTNKEPYEEGLVGFEPIFQFHFNNSYVPVSENGGSPSGLVTRFELKGIKVHDSDSGYHTDLHNWAHIKLESAVELEGLYVQAISAPWGVPFGEFVADFDCGDCSLKTSEFTQAINIIPCMHRPALAYRHPSVLTVGGKQSSAGKRILRRFREIHFNFRYTQYPCVEHTFAQFLVVAVRNFHESSPRFETFFSPIYEMKIDKNPNGVYYPFHYGWQTKSIKCHESSLEEVMEPVKGVNAKGKIRYSKSFDNCVVNKEGKEFYTCPPGPIQMKNENIPNNLDSWKNLRKKFTLEEKEKGSTRNGSNSSVGGAQFCFDSGRWEWMIGKLEWPMPKNLSLHEHSIDFEEMIEGEDDQIPEEGRIVLDCDEYYKDPRLFDVNPDFAIFCNELYGAPQCNDIHRKQCDNLEDIPIPTFGKGLNGSRLERSKWEEITFSEQFDELAWRYGEKYVLGSHGISFIFAFTAIFNILAFVARYYKGGLVEKGENEKQFYENMELWLWVHMIFSYVFICSASYGFFLVALQNYQSGDEHGIGNVNGLRDLCNVHGRKNETDFCLNSTAHRYFGVAALFLFGLSFISGWTRPNTPGLRKIAIVYHVGCGCFSKIAALISICYVIPTLKSSTLILVGLVELSNLIFMSGSCILSKVIDMDVGLDPPRKVFPVLEGVETIEIPKPYAKFKLYIFPVFVFVQLALTIPIMFI